MITTYRLLMISSSILFLWYGLSSLYGNGMIDEFARFGLSDYRRVTGGFEVLGAIGLLAGLIVPRLVVVSAAGLSLLMLLGLITRVRVRDPWIQMLPALFLMFLNVFLAVHALRGLRNAQRIASITLG